MKKIINNKYIILDKIGSGTFGTVYKGINKKTVGSIAIKTESISAPIRTLKNETSILKYLYDHGCRSIPIVYWYGVDTEFIYLVMPLYQYSLYEYCIQTELESKKINRIMYVCIDILETIHKQFVLHRDIKPQNFMIVDEDIFLIDFGFASFYIDEKGDHLPAIESDQIIGTPKYISYPIHCGVSPSRRDDLISLGYLYIYLCCRELPWDSLKMVTEIDRVDNTCAMELEIHISHYKNVQRKEYKSWIQLEPICSHINKEITNYLQYCYGLSYSGTPNYTALKQLFSV